VTSLARPQSSRDPYFLLIHPRHTAPFLRLFVPNSLTVHLCSFSSKAVLAVSPVVLATPCSDYSPAVTSSAPFLGLFVSSNSMVQRLITFILHIHSVHIHSRSGGWCFYVTGSSSVLFHFFVSEGVDPSTRSSVSPLLIY
jgi:hypothetical protein